MLIALVIDHVWGEPAVRWHPVVWMGSALGWAGQRMAPLGSSLAVGVWAEKIKPFCMGALVWCTLSALVFAVALSVQSGLMWRVQATWFSGESGMWADSTRTLAAAVVLGALLKPLFALRMLGDEVRAVEAALAQSLAAGRERLSWLVSREVARLTEGEVRESAIETLAENFNDSVVAPLFWFALAGLPGAALYRLANTADAMWGYRGERGGRDWTWAGKWAARADDVLSWLPARITALLFTAVAAFMGVCRLRHHLSHLRHLPHEARRTPSPNSGWPMAAMALVLGIRLGKPGAYVLNPSGRTPQSADVFLALRFIKKTSLALYFIAISAIVFASICSLI